MSQLPIITIGPEFYFVDECLRQIRAVDNPHDFWDFPEGLDTGAAIVAFRRRKANFFGQGDDPNWLPLKLREDV